MPDAKGNIKGIAVPKVPWHDNQVTEWEPDGLSGLKTGTVREFVVGHNTFIAEQLSLGDEPGRSLYYFYCSCGACGNFHTRQDTAQQEAEIHRDL